MKIAVTIFPHDEYARIFELPRGLDPGRRLTSREIRAKACLFEERFLASLKQGFQFGDCEHEWADVTHKGDRVGRQLCTRCGEKAEHLIEPVQRARLDREAGSEETLDHSLIPEIFGNHRRLLSEEARRFLGVRELHYALHYPEDDLVSVEFKIEAVLKPLRSGRLDPLKRADGGCKKARTYAQGASRPLRLLESPDPTHWRHICEMDGFDLLVLNGNPCTHCGRAPDPKAHKPLHMLPSKWPTHWGHVCEVFGWEVHVSNGMKCPHCGLAPATGGLVTVTGRDAQGNVHMEFQEHSVERPRYEEAVVVGESLLPARIKLADLGDEPSDDEFWRRMGGVGPCPDHLRRAPRPKAPPVLTAEHVRNRIDDLLVDLQKFVHADGKIHLRIHPEERHEVEETVLRFPEADRLTIQEDPTQPRGFIGAWPP